MSEEQENAKEVGESTTAILMLIRNMGLDHEKALGAVCVAVVRVGRAAKKKRREMRKLFNRMAQEFSDDEPLSTAQALEDLKEFGFMAPGRIHTGQVRPTREQPHFQKK